MEFNAGVVGKSVCKLGHICLGDSVLLEKISDGKLNLP